MLGHEELINKIMSLGYFYLENDNYIDQYIVDEDFLEEYKNGTFTNFVDFVRSKNNTIRANKEFALRKQEFFSSISLHNLYSRNKLYFDLIERTNFLLHQITHMI